MGLRPYRIEDWSQVREIYDLSKPDELLGVVDPSAILPLESDPKMMTLFRDSQMVVMERANRIVGFAGSRGSFVTWLFVHPSYRRQGVATALLRDMLKRLEGPVTLNVAMSNHAALALYQRSGFAVEREFVGQVQGNSCKVAKLRHETAV
jgi:putative acetyltransferase